MEELLKMGITRCFSGYKAVLEAMTIFEGDPSQKDQIMHTYMEIGRNLNADWRCVERNLRTLVKKAWMRNPKFLEQIMDRPLIKPPAAGDFLVCLYEFSRKRGA